MHAPRGARDCPYAYRRVLAILREHGVSCVVNERRALLCDVAESTEQLALDCEVLDDALDHEVAVGEAAEVVGGGDPGDAEVPQPQRGLEEQQGDAVGQQLATGEL